MEDDDVYDLIERPRSVRVLIALLESPEDAPVSEILEGIGGSRSTGINRLDEFRESGLVIKQAGDNRTIYSLTENGEKVARHLVNVIEIIQGDSNDG